MAICDWGPRVDAGNLPDLYAPQKVLPFTPTPAGIDNLALSSIDTFVVPGVGTFEVNFSGYFRVAREASPADTWASYGPYVNMIDIRLRGSSSVLGTITVRLNPDIVSAGQVFPSGSDTQAAACRIASGVTFDANQIGTLFNKEPILLMNDGIDSVPPVEDPNGQAHIYRLPLYSMQDPEGKPKAYLTSLRYTVGNYVTFEEAEKFREW